MPVGACVVGIAAFAPCINFGGQGGGVGDASVETLTGEHGQLGLGQIEPASVLGGVVPLEALDDPARLGRRERFVERGSRVRVQIVLNQHDLLGLREVYVGEITQDLRIVNGRALL